MKGQEVFVEDETKQWQNIADGVKRKIMAYDDKLMLVKVAFEKGSVGSVHKHSHSQITNIESGRFEIIVNNKKKIMKAGDAFYIPPNADHGCVCIEDGVLIDVFSPMREDFLNGNGKEK